MVGPSSDLRFGRQSAGSRPRDFRVATKSCDGTQNAVLVPTLIMSTLGVLAIVSAPGVDVRGNRAVDRFAMQSFVGVALDEAGQFAGIDARVCVRNRTDGQLLAPDQAPDHPGLAIELPGGLSRCDPLAGLRHDATPEKTESSYLEFTVCFARIGRSAMEQAQLAIESTSRST